MLFKLVSTNLIPIYDPFTLTNKVLLKNGVYVLFANRHIKYYMELTFANVYQVKKHRVFFNIHRDMNWKNNQLNGLDI